jgi:hypothetical protein
MGTPATGEWDVNYGSQRTHRITAGGLSILSDRFSYFLLDESGRRDEVWSGLHSVDIATGVERRAAFERKQQNMRFGSLLEFGGSPHGDRVAVVEHWSVRQETEGELNELTLEQVVKERRKRLRLTLTIAAFDGSPPVELITKGHAPKASLVGGSADNDGVWTPVQWSPDGRLLAVQLSVTKGDTEHQAVRVFDTATWQEIACFDDGHLYGCASWGPDSDRFLMGAHLTKGRHAHWVQHVDGTRQLLTIMPEQNNVMRRPWWPVGMVDNDHLLTMRAPRHRATLMRTKLTTGEHEDVFTWPGQFGGQMVVAQMPPETWEP